MKNAQISHFSAHKMTKKSSSKKLLTALSLFVFIWHLSMYDWLLLLKTFVNIWGKTMSRFPDNYKSNYTYMAPNHQVPTVVVDESPDCHALSLYPWEA